MNKHTWIFIAAMIGLIGGGLLYRHFAQDVDSRGATRLMRAIEGNDTGKMDKFLHAGDINVRDKAGQTALFYAARHATEPKVIYQLIVAGSDPLATDKAGNTPLTTAAKYNPSTAVVLALAKQGNRHPQQQQANKNKALQRAAKYNSADVIKALLIAHASPVVPKERSSAAAYLAENEKLTEQEKTDFRQAMLVLEILEAREQFAKSMNNAEPNDKVLTKVKEVFIKKEQPNEEKSIQQVPAVISEKQLSTVAEVSTDEVPVPQEKQMDEAK